MKILVTGSSGFTGEVLIPKLEKAGFQIIGLDWKKGKYTNIIQDISKPFDVKDKIDAVIHLAARLEHDRCSKEEYFLTNIKGTHNVLNVAEKHNAYFVYISTTAIYGSPDSPITENTLIKPHGNYAISKWEGEQVCQKFIKNGLNVCIVRPSVLIGKKRLGIYKIIFKNLLKNSSIPILGDGTNKISFVNIEDFTEFLIYLITKKLKNIIINFGGKIPGDLNYVLKELKSHSNSTSKILHIPIQLIGLLRILSLLKLIPITTWQLSVMHKDYYYNNDILSSTGYEYKHEPINALKAMVDYYKMNFFDK